jgi:hypothetical protein
MERFNRAERRRQIARLKKARKLYWSYDYEMRYRGRIMPKSTQGKVVQYPAACSCPMCGNPRRHFGHRTLREESFLQKGW